MSSDNELFPSGGCVHLQNYKKEHGIRSYNIICGCIVACNSKETLKAKAHCCICQICYAYKPRLHACLFCSFFGCYNERHIHEHALVKDHFFAVDVTHGFLLCFQCGDYVHDVDFIAILRRHKKRSARLLGLRNQYYPWEASRIDLKLLTLNPDRGLTTKDSYIGLRGLVNIGQTCYMNCILQFLLHTPLLRDYFLSGMRVCKQSNQPSHNDLSCLLCEMYTLFQECYSGKQEPYIPSRLLTVIWLKADHLADNQQHDAHEFFMTILNILHEHFVDGSAISKSPVEGCSCCIVHQIFNGKLKTDIICENCQQETSHINSFIDVSLDLGDDSTGPNKTKARGKASEIVKKTFSELLERHFRGESFSRNCGSCNNMGLATRHKTIMKLPIIISFHFQRHQRTYKKDTYVSFPEFVDMTRFLLPFQKRENSVNNNVENSTSVPNRYCLFTVVSHIGNVKGGHYICYIRPKGNLWYKCSDQFITVAQKEEVMASEAYLLFYHKQVLEYE